MSDQETAVVEETTETGVEPRTETDSSGPSSPAEPNEAPETLPSDDVASVTTTTTETAEPFQADEPKPTDTPAADEPVSILNLKPRQHLAGKVKNITSFGAFVDIGLPQDGLVHISELARQKVDKVTDVVSEGQEVDKKRGRISLTMVKPITRRFRDINEEDEFEGVVTRLESYGAFIDIDSDREGLVHISQITHDYINHPEEALAIGDKVKVKVLKVNRKKRQVDLSIKALLAPPPPPEPVVVEPEPEEIRAEEPAQAEDESAPTALALAYAAFQSEKKSSSPTKMSTKAKREQKQELEAIIARTLAAREN
jgi:predicted RNA-binding protein with RPS1 domain